MTLNDMAEAVNKMLDQVADLGFDPKNIRVTAIHFSHQVEQQGVDIDGHYDEKQPTCEVWLIP